MDHKDWGSDDFLDDFLDFKYDNSAHRADRDHQEVKPAQKLPTEKKQETRQENKKYGLGEDSYREYERLRRASYEDAGRKADNKAEDLRASDAFKADIPEPLSSRRDRKAPEPDNSQQVRKKASFSSTIDEPLGNGDRKPRSIPEDQGTAEKANAASGKALFSSIADRIGSKAGDITKHRNIKASEFASEAITAAKKFVASEEDKAPEVIPSRQAEPVNAGAERDELAELFQELGETAPSDNVMSSDEDLALRKAQEDAYDRYRHNVYKKAGKNKRKAARGAGAVPRWISRIYVLALAVFVAIMTFMNVLPFGMLIAFYVILGLLSVIITAQLRKKNVQTWVRVIASLTAIVMIAFFGVGTAYAMGTLSFLDKTSVKNENRVRNVTREPFNVCITGIDAYGYIDEEGRSDVNMVITVNPKTEQVLMTSIPRDYQIYMPDKDYAMDKLTHTGFYGVNTTIGAEENLLETKINYYVKVNFTTVKAFIYAIGGVYVYSDYEFYPVKMPEWKVEKGWNYMSGKKALAFARERKAFPDGDNQRIKNQQAVLEAVIDKATSSKTMALDYNKILSELRDYFQMSFSSGELRALIKLQLARNPEWKIYKNSVTGGDGSMQTYSTGSAYAYVMTQDEESINNAKTLIQAVMNGEMLEEDEDGNVVVVGAETTDTQEEGETDN